MRTRKAPQADRAGGWLPSRGLGRHDQGCGGGGAPRTAARGGWRWARAGRAGWGRFPSATMGQPTRLAWLHCPRPTQRLWGVAAGHPRGQRPIHLPESEAIGRASGERGACHGVLALGPPSWAHPHPQRLTDGGINKSAKRDQLQPRARSIRSGRSMCQHSIHNNPRRRGLLAGTGPDSIHTGNVRLVARRGSAACARSHASWACSMLGKRGCSSMEVEHWGACRHLVP